MVGFKLLTHVYRRLNEIKGFSKDPSVFCGNMNVLAFGDFYQLRPVFDSFVFQKDVLGVHIWKELFRPVFLSTNHRQKGDRYLRLLTNIRLGHLTNEDELLLEARLFTSEILDHDPQFKDALWIFPARKSAADYNKLCMARLSESANTPIISSIACDELLDGPPHITRENAHMCIPSDGTITAGLSKELTLSVGCRVMLLRNINCNDGLVREHIQI